LYLNTTMERTLPIKPTLAHETRLWRAGWHYIAGIDEVGRGALAGPVVAAAVIVPPQALLSGIWALVGDSKGLSPAQRTRLAPQIQAAALAWSIGITPATTIDQIGIAAATRQAMQQAVTALHPAPNYLLLDWVKLPQVNLAQESFIKADRDIVSVAAASILAKVARDQFMVALHDRYPIYGFKQHKGYGTAAHLTALQQHGPCAEHRHTFAPLARPLSLFDGERELTLGEAGK
jgi:ribonuclease HII